MTKHNELIHAGWAGKQYGQGIFRDYKISTNDVKELMQIQNGKCPGCNQPLADPWNKQGAPGLKPHIDHAHYRDADGNQIIPPSTKRCERQDVRGLLCAACNVWMGELCDDEIDHELYIQTPQLVALKAYLRSPPAPWFKRREY
jgi:hypothetical protein